MRFSYFSNADNTYANNDRTVNALIEQIVDQSIHAERVGMHAAWVGEHHFNEFGTNPSPEVVLTHVLAKTERLRVMPAVVVLPLHHPLRVAEQWATMDLLSGGRVDFAVGRGFDKNEYDRFEIDFEDNAAIMAEGLEIIHRAWNEKGRWSHEGAYWHFEDVEVVPRPVQDPLPTYVACFSRPTLELTARHGYGMSIAPFAAGMSFGGVDNQIACYREACAANGRPPGPVNSSYFLHFADTPEEDRRARERQMRFFRENALASMKTARRANTKSYDYWYDMAERVGKLRPQELKPGSVLLGTTRQITDAVGAIADDGVEEVGLYVNVGLKDPTQTKDEMQRFMEEVAPSFAAR